MMRIKMVPAVFRLSYDNSVLHCKLDQICACFKTEIVHDVVFVKGHCARRDLQNACRFFHRFSFSQKLNDFSLTRSEEHTSELQSPCNLVCRLLLEKKNVRGHAAAVGDKVLERRPAPPYSARP